MNEGSIARVGGAISYLRRMGWAPSRPSIYRHMEAGVLSRPPWSAGALDAYAKEFLRPAAGAPDPPAEQQDAAGLESKRAVSAEILGARKEKLQVELQLKQLELDIERGKYISVDDHVRRTCKIMLLVKDATLNWIYEHAPELIDAAGGSRERFWDVVLCYQTAVSKYLARLDADGPILRDIPPASDFKDEPL